MQQNQMILTRLFLLFAFVSPLPVLAQTITAKFQVNLLHIPESIPWTLGAGLEMGISAKSSVQLSGLYRQDPTGYGSNQGPKVYLDYRYYVKPQNQKNSGFYISPFLGIGHQQRAADGDDFDGFTKEHTLDEKLAGFLIGYQPYRKSSRFTVDLYAGPEYQWRVEHYYFNDFAHLPSYQLNKNRTWFRAGLTLCFRVKK